MRWVYIPPEVLRRQRVIRRARHAAEEVRRCASAMWMRRAGGW